MCVYFLGTLGHLGHRFSWWRSKDPKLTCRNTGYFLKSGRTWSHDHFYLLAQASHLGKVMHSVTATVHWDFLKKKWVFKRSYLFLMPIFLNMLLYIEWIKLKLPRDCPLPDSFFLIPQMILYLPFHPLSKI